MGVSSSCVSHWINGSNGIGSKNLRSLCEILKCEQEWLLSGKGEPDRIESPYKPVILWDSVEDLPEGDYTLVPRLDVTAAAGQGYENEDYPVHKEPVAYRTDWIKKSKAASTDLIVIEVKGNSMSPLINAEDTVLIDKSQCEVKNGQVFAFLQGNELRIKRLSRSGGKLIIESDNKTLPEYKYPEELDESELGNIRIIGRVVNRSGSGGL